MALKRSDFEALDATDPLGAARARFDLPAGINYLDGNSLGALPKGVVEHVAAVIREDWGTGLIRSWNAAGWFAAPARVGAKLAPLLGAAPHQVIVTDTISINLFKLLVAAARMRPGRNRIIAEAGNFPSDNYVVESVCRMLDLEAVFVPADQIAAAIDETTAVVELSHVNYRTAEIQDMATLTAAAHAKGALIIWDLAHSTGAVELQLDRDRADYAVGCGYKFLNGGPGAPSHAYVAERHLMALDQPLTGWFAHAAPFAFTDGFRKIDNIKAMLCSTPQMLSLASHEAALSVFDGVSMRNVQAKGRALGEAMIELYDDRIAPLGFGLATTRDGLRRGNHVSITHPGGFAMMQALIAGGVIGDFRAPDVLRFGFGPLYVRFVDVYDAVAALEGIVSSGSWRAVAPPAANTVT